jgi:large subunit ribosomal protein L6
MSRIGRLPVAVPAGVNVELAGQRLSIKGKLGAHSLVLHDEVTAKVEDGRILLAPRSESKRGRTLWGTSRALVANMVTGASKGFTRSLELHGIGNRAEVQGKTLNLQLGFSHDVKVPIPEGIAIKVDATKIGERQGLIEITGADKRLVGQVAAEIRALKKPEPYKGKGIRYANEYVRRKEGKKK